MSIFFKKPSANRRQAMDIGYQTPPPSPLNPIGTPPALGPRAHKGEKYAQTPNEEIQESCEEFFRFAGLLIASIGNPEFGDDVRNNLQAIGRDDIMNVFEKSEFFELIAEEYNKLVINDPNNILNLLTGKEPIVDDLKPDPEETPSKTAVRIYLIFKKDCETKYNNGLGNGSVQRDEKIEFVIARVKARFENIKGSYIENFQMIR